jgi:hypothetical protein
MASDATMIVLNSHQRELLRHALLRHRQGYTHSEADYVKDVLQVALNTYKKCVSVGDAEDLAMKRRTLTAILKAANIAPAAIAVDLVMPSAAEEFGNYDPQQFSYLVGTYFLHRRSFQTGHNIVRGVIEISINEQKRCLRFEEYNDYISDGGMHDDSLYGGDLYMNEERSLYSMFYISNGYMRLTMTQAPVRSGPGPAGTLPPGGIKLRGGLFTHGRGKGVWQPTFSPVSIASLPERQWKQAREQCRTIKPDDPEFEALNRELVYAEDYASVVTPLMFNRASGPKGGR